MEVKFVNSYNNQNNLSLNFKKDKLKTNVNNKKNNDEESEKDSLLIKTDKEIKKISTKKAFLAGGIVLFIGGIVAILNPKNSSKILQNIKNLQAKLRINLDNSKNNFIQSKFGKFLDKTLDLTSRIFSFTGNFNNAKDILYDNICSKKRSFTKVKNKHIRKGLVKTNNVFTNIMTKINNKITLFFDSISQATVKSKYKKATKSLDKFEFYLNNLKSKLPAEEQKIIDEKLKQIVKERAFFNEENLIKRFQKQEEGMKKLNLKEKVTKKIKVFISGYKNRKQDIKTAANYTDRNLSLWSEDFLKNYKENLKKEGDDAVLKLFSENKSKSGLYDEIIDITEKYLSPEEQKILLKSRKNCFKKLKNANKSECNDYFDKKRDIFLGGAPTDILSGLLGIGVGTAAIISADSKEQKRARLFSDTTFPLIPTALGIVSSMVMTAMLFSGATGLLVGGAVTVCLSKLGSLINKYVFDYDEDAIAEAKKLAEKEQKELLKAEKLQKRLEKVQENLEKIQKKETKNV